MKPSSAKAKGRRLQNIVARMIRETLDLPESDVRPAIMGETGCDIKLSARAAAAFPFAVECKCQESLNVWAALDQAEENGQVANAPALLIFKRNHSKMYAAVSFETLLGMCSEIQGLETEIAALRSSMMGGASDSTH